MRNKSVRKTRDVGAGRGSYVSRLYGYLQTRPINRFIAGSVQGISITREKEREDFSRDSIARFISIGGKEGAGIKLILDQDIEPAETDDLCRYYFAAGH